MSLQRFLSIDRLFNVTLEVGHGSHKESFDIFLIIMVRRERLFIRFAGFWCVRFTLIIVERVRGIQFKTSCKVKGLQKIDYLRISASPL